MTKQTRLTGGMLVAAIFVVALAVTGLLLFQHDHLNAQTPMRRRDRPRQSARSD